MMSHIGRGWLIAALLVLVVPGAGWAGAWSKGCKFTGGNVTGTIGTPDNTSKVIGNTDYGCYRFNNADGLHNSTIVQITAEEALVCFDPQLDAKVVAPTAALVTVHWCPTWGPLDTSNPQYSCIDTGGAGAAVSLDGVEGNGATQNACKWMGPGVIYFEVTGACLAGDTCQVSVQGAHGSP